MAKEHEPSFYPALLFLLSSGCRRGELLGLKWEDVDFSTFKITIRRAISTGRVTTPKSGKGRTVEMPPVGSDAARAQRSGLHTPHLRPRHAGGGAGRVVRRLWRHWNGPIRPLLKNGAGDELANPVRKKWWS